MIRLRLIIAAVVLICVAIAFGVWHVIKERHEARVARLVAELKSDNRAIRNAAREELAGCVTPEEMRWIVHPRRDDIRDADIPVRMARAFSMFGKTPPDWLVKGTSKLGTDAERLALAQHLVDTGDTRGAVPVLIATLQSTDADIREESARLLSPIHDQRSFEPLAKCFEAASHSESDMVSSAAGGIAASGSKEAADFLLKGLKNPDPVKRAACAAALRHIVDPRIVPPLIETLQDSDIETATWAATILGDTGDVRAVEPLMACVRQGRLSTTASAALGRIGDPRAVPLLAEELKPLRNLSALNGPNRARTPEERNAVGRVVNALLALESIGTPEACKAVDEFIAPVDLAVVAGEYPSRLMNASQSRTYGLELHLAMIRHADLVQAAMESSAAEITGQGASSLAFREQMMEAERMRWNRVAQRRARQARLQSTGASAESVTESSGALPTPAGHQ